MPNKYLPVFICICVYQLAAFIGLQTFSKPEYPVLNKRIGTLLWRDTSKPPDFKTHNIYCYYPSAEIFQGGEYLIKKVESINECKNWYGITQISEPEETSEKDKLTFPSDFS